MSGEYKHERGESFYQTFVREILQGDFQADPRVENPEFRKFIIQERGESLESIGLFRDSLATTLQKPQRCLYSDSDWYLAIDTYTSTFYVAYRNLMMVDIDYGKGNHYSDVEQVLEFLRKYCLDHQGRLLDVYASSKGVHVFILDQPLDYHRPESWQLMLDLGCDFYYVIYASLRGWSVRVNAKVGESRPIYRPLGRIGEGVALPQLECLVALHLNFCQTFSDVHASKMR